MRRLSLTALLLVACGDGLPPPRILELTPSSMLASDAPEVTLRLEGVLPYEIDYGASSASVDTAVTVTLGEERLGPAPYRADGSVTVFVPSLFQPGELPVTVHFADGRQATAPAPFVVTPGDWPSQYVFTPIGPQRADQPFEVRIQARRSGDPLLSFRGTVTLELRDGGSLTPTRTAPFDSGEAVERQVLISAPGQHALRLRDANGTTALSNTFTVAP